MAEPDAPTVEDEAPPRPPGEDVLSFGDALTSPTGGGGGIATTGAGLERMLASLGLTKADTTRSTQLEQELQKVWAQRDAALQAGLERRKSEVAGAENAANTMAVDRAAARPGPLNLPPIPTPQPRNFLEPAPEAGLISQLTTVFTGITQIAQQMAGLKGNSTLALVSLGGALQGWQAGDNQRADREIKAWERQTQRLLAEHKDRVEQYGRFIEDQNLSWSQKFSLIGLRAQADQFGDMVLASKERDIERLLASQQKAEGLQQTQRINFAKAVDQIEQRQQQIEEARRQHDLEDKRFRLGLLEKAEQAALTREQKADLAAQTEALRRDLAAQTDATRRQLGEMSAGFRQQGLDLQREGLDLRKQLASDKQADKQKGFQTMGRVLEDMDGMVDKMDQAGILPKGESKIGEWQASAARWSKPNQDTWRQWQALQGAMVGFERQIYDDKGARALSVYKSLLEFVDKPPTATTAHDVIKRMRGYLEASSPGSGSGAAKPGDPLGILR